MLREPETIVDEEIHALIEPSPLAAREERQFRRRRRRAVGMLLHPERRMERILSGSIAEQLRGTPPTRTLQILITQKIIDLFWTALPEENARWLRATHVAHDIAAAVMHELAPPQHEGADPFSLEDEIPSVSRN